MPLPDGEYTFTYSAASLTTNVVSPAVTKPISFGSIADGGPAVEISVNIGPFAGPVNVALSIYDAAFDPQHVYYFDSNNQTQEVASVMDEGDNDSLGEKTMTGNPFIWRANVTSVNETILGPVPASNLAPGIYILHLEVTPIGVTEGVDAGSGPVYYRWITYLVIP